jgi:ribosomal protein S12 methylthiotransferase accessory factor
MVMDISKEVVAQRAYNLDEALLIGSDESRKNLITPRFKCVGAINQNELIFSTYLCAANDDQLQLSCLGGASGISQQAKVKALYESLEKSISLKLCKHNQINGIHSFSTATSPSSQFLLDNQLMPKLLLQKEYQQENYHWLELTHYLNKTKKVYYPLSLIYSFIPKIHPLQNDYLSELSDDTGLAIGATREEAIIHGINQWIERDAYSLFLLKSIINKTPAPARLVLKETLPSELAQIVTAIEKNFNENLIIVEITTDLNIPAFVVSFTKQNIMFQPQGFGASLSKEAALKQALFESIQYKDRLNEQAITYREKALTFFSKSPLLLKAMIGDLKSLMDKELFVKVEWNQIVSYPLSKNLKNQIEQMVVQLTEHKANVYTTVLYESDTGVAITYTLIPELENFSLIRDGKFVPIKTRGLGVIHEHQF